MRAVRNIAILVLCLAALPTFAHAAGGAYPWSDSLSAKLSLSGPSLQDVLTTLGYSINVATDELPNQTVFKPGPAFTLAELRVKYRGSSSLSDFGWYPQNNPNAKTLLIAGSDPVGTMVAMVPPADSVGLYLGPTLFDDIWYTTKGQNWDLFKHARVFSAGANRYVIAWEDLADGGDQDYEDAIFELLYVNPNELRLSFVGQQNYLFCTEQEICFDVNGSGGIGSLTLQIRNGITFQTVATGLSPLAYENCFLPWPVDSVHKFVFKLSDTNGNTVIDSFLVNVQFRENPILTLSDELIDTTVCDLDSICIDVASAFDYDNDQLLFTLYQSPPANIDSLTGEICFKPLALDSMMYQFIIVAYDSCCQSYGFPADPREKLPCPRDTLYVIVRYQGEPIITTIPDTTITLCKDAPSTVCFPATAATESRPVPLIQECGPGLISNGELCFNAAASGLYTFCFKAADACGGFVYDTVKVNIIIDATPPVANAGRDSTLSLCAPQPICWAAGCSGADLATCELISTPGTFNGSQICFTPPASGTYRFILRATDNCGNVDLDTAIINLTLKNPPVALVRDTAVNFCVTQQVCIPATCSDPDGDLTLCEKISGAGTYNNGQICFTPDTSGTYRFILKATDACGATDLDTGFAVVKINRRPDVVPGSGSYLLCEPGQICVPFTATDPDGNPLTITTTMGTINGNQVCLNSGGPGTRLLSYQVIARDGCGAADTALFNITVRVNMPPILTTPTPTPKKLCDPEQLCFNVSALDTIVAKLVYSLQSGPGTINASTGQVCFTPTQDGNFSWNIVVTDSCGKADTGQVNWNVDFIDPPSPIIVAPDTDTLVCYDSALTDVCVSISYNDAPNTTITARPTNASVNYSFNYSGGSGQLCFDPLVNENKTYTFEFKRKNECGDSTLTLWNYTVEYVDCDSACIVVEIEKTPCINLGTIVTMNVYYEGRLPVGGYDLLLTYDVTAFSFLSASIGPAISGWEYFTYRLGPFGNCSGSCPSGMVRLVALADANNGANHPPASQFMPTGSIARLTFRTTSNNNFDGQVYPVNFYWLDCGDNAFSTVSGDTLLVDDVIFNPYGMILWDEDDEVLFPESNRLPNLGAPDTCLSGDKYEPIRCVEFHNGFICIIDNDSIDARGDLNLNAVANEIADAVLYTNYFIRGLVVFNISRPAQIAASDINNDGLTLTVGDLVYLLRIIIGDAQPIPKLAPFANSVEFTPDVSDQAVTLWANSTSNIGGLYLRARVPDGAMPTVTVADAADDLTLAYETVDGILNILIYSENHGARIEAGRLPLLTISSPVTIEHIEAADYDGNQLRSSLGKTVLPTEFELGQNYPNPFNPTTTITFALPQASDWALSIVNISGQIVKRFEGSAPAGTQNIVWDATDVNGQVVATGVYFYRLEAGSFAATKKMVLMK